MGFLKSASGRDYAWSKRLESSVKLMSKNSISVLPQSELLVHRLKYTSSVTHAETHIT
jgi:hypothetical protein